jgi:acyl transferase domain-containing protein/NAD(P)H-dependent flavin oxidoreductase YrpB (nitropropane dioxygenase family)/NAD(P)-dependent dehydrogenase (short-subunit alcohol dehydrogenase family)
MTSSPGPEAELRSGGFDFIVMTPPGLADPALAIAASRAGAIGVLDLQFVGDTARVLTAVSILARLARGRCGIKLSSTASPQFDRVLSELSSNISVAVLSPTDPRHVLDRVRALRDRKLAVLLEVVSDAEARAGRQAGVDGLIAKGHESGGRVGEETTFVLLQRLLGSTDIPVWAQGGIGLHSAAACVAAGAAGVVLDSQLALTRESTLPDGVKAAIARFDGSETTCVGSELDARIRVMVAPGSTALAELRRFGELHPAESVDDDARNEWWRHAGLRIGWGDPDRQVWPIGQEAASAASLARRFDRVAGVLAAFREAASSSVRAARIIKPLDEGSPLARTHGTRYPIVQGPMTRVSDRAAFALRVAEGGALPFLALALMRAAEVERLLDETRAALGARPWGVGILGFVPDDVRAEQLDAVRAAMPSVALIAGGRPDQALSLERVGIPTYLHVPSPGLLKLFIESGARRFVFEGRECGGHVGPRGSFALWDAAVETLLGELPTSDIAACQVLFAGGIHDARSASMVAALAAPLAERGAKIGVLLGTAYLFTHEAVATGAIIEGFQQQALACRHTLLLSSGPGHSTRCAVTPFADQFARERQRLLDEARTSEEVHAALEALNLGRLRVATKGLRRSGNHVEGGASALVGVTDVEQRADGMYMIGQVAALRDSTCAIEDLHHDVSRAGSERLDRSMSVRPAGKVERRNPRPFDIAIVGMSCLLPKAPDVRTYWDNILQKVNAVTEVPPGRWDWRMYYDPDPGAADKVNSKWGGFLDPIRFDPARYGMPPNSLASIEPLQLLTLAAVRAALADAGCLERGLSRDRTAVILGVSGGIADLGQQYAVRSALPMLIDPVPAAWLSQLASWTEDSFPGILPNVAAGRVANRFDFAGVNYTVDAACASSLAAVYLACRELESGTSDVVVVGGADTIQNPFAYLCFGKTHALSPRGRCATFDESADGIAISEGVAILVLKRVVDAERDGDRIRAVIRGVAGSSDGRHKGLTAPLPEGQALALERAYAMAGVSPPSVGLVEAHGTGTVAGDRAELETLNRVFGAAGAAAESCAIGSVKSMVGHTKSTAGVAGLIKVALALQHKVLPPTLHVSTPNEGARRSGSPLYVNSEPRPWLHTDPTVPRRAGVSAFGFGGTNFHAVLEEYTGEYLESNREASSRCWPSELLIWSGESRAAIQASIARLSQAIERGACPRLCDLSYSTWKAARKPKDVTLAMAVKSIDELTDQLKWSAHALQDSIAPAVLASRKISFTESPLAHGGRTAFIFPGQGSQYPGMLSELTVYLGDVRKPFERATGVLAQRLPRPLSTYVFPPPRFRDEDRQADLEALTATTVAQPALGAAGLALYRLLGECAVHPDMAAGHSYGEYAALCVAGTFDEDTFYSLSEARGRCIVETAGGERAAMAGVAADRDRTSTIIGGIGGVWVANINSRSQTVISGSREAVDAAIDRFTQAGIVARRLSVACAFHSPLMVAARERLTRIIQSVELRPPRLPVFSNVSAQPYPQDRAAIIELLAEQLVSPVRFADQIEAMYSAGARVFIETGPGHVLSGLVDQILDTKAYVAVPVDFPGRSGLFQFQNALGLLAAHGVPVDLDPLFARRDVRLLDLDAPSTDYEEPVSPTTWIVTGGSATPVRSTSADATAAPLLPNVAPDPHTVPEALQVPGAARMRQPVSNPSSAPESADEAAYAMSQFQQLMAGFLETQKQVMLAYLNSNGAGHPFDTARTPGASSESTTATIPSPPMAAFAPPLLTAVAPHDSDPARMQSPAELGAGESVDLTVELLSIVSDRTGYPTELLGLDLNIEADLGIDSIKRIEIVGEFGRRALRGRGIELNDIMAQLTAGKTLRSIADSARILIDGVLAPALARSDDSLVAPEPNIDMSTQGELPRFLFAIEDAPLPTPAARVGPDDLVVITDDGHGVAEQAAASLRAAGAQVAILGTAGSGSAKRSTDDPTDARAVMERLDAVRAHHARLISGILHLEPLRHQPNTAGIAATQAAANDTRSLLHFARGAASDLRKAGTDGRGWLIAAIANGGAFGAQADPDEWVFGHGSIAGFMKALAVEWPDVRCKLVDLESRYASEAAERLVSEIVAAPDFVEVGWRGSRRLAVRPVRAPLRENEESGPAIDSKAVLLVTGGARGITAAIATDIARRYRPTLVIVGRTGLASRDEPPHVVGIRSERDLKAALLAEARRTGQQVSTVAIEKMYTLLIHQREVRANLDTMQRLGARVDYRPVDVVDDGAFGAAIEDIYARYGRLDGVIHGAGVIEDALVEHKTPDSFARVFDTKVRSAATLARHIRPESLRFLALFSSVAGCFGNRGQVDYAAANESLNKLALHLDRQWPGRVVSLNWGPWASNGMASESTRRQLSDRGMTPIEAAAGCLAFDRELRCGLKGEVEVVLGHGRWGQGAAPVSSHPADQADISSVCGD